MDLNGNRKGRAKVVSFDRPYEDPGSMDFLGIELPLVTLAESLGLPLSYVTDTDIHATPDYLSKQRAVLTLGHDEYWSDTMREAIVTARDSGAHLAFFGANAIYRRVRFEAGSGGRPDRLMVNWRSTEDPIGKTDPGAVTVEWRSPPVDKPEQEICGIQYEGAGVRADWVVTAPQHWIYTDTGLAAGDKISAAVGGEYDRVFQSVPQPAGLEVLAESPLTYNGNKTKHNAAFHRAPSGAGVFSTGSVAWIDCLDGGAPEQEDDGTMVRRITENVLRRFAEGPF
ncbi:MAG: hypothetical protein IT198_01470 [Acidimicrobiia bacterium]|nr:hypothetical protein [Acidimicrobiia bacterium]